MQGNYALPITFKQSALICWVFTWRTIILMFLIAVITGFIVDLISTSLNIKGANLISLHIVSQLLAFILFIFILPRVMRTVLSKKYKEVKIVLVK